MKCALANELKEEHAKMTKSGYAGILFTCPVLTKQICMWCCLHIADMADPKKREYMVGKFPRYAEIVTKISGRDLDDIFRTCSRCRNR